MTLPCHAGMSQNCLCKPAGLDYTGKISPADCSSCILLQRPTDVETSQQHCLFAVLCSCSVFTNWSLEEEDRRSAKNKS